MLFRLERFRDLLHDSLVIFLNEAVKHRFLLTVVAEFKLHVSLAPLIPSLDGRLIRCVQLRIELVDGEVVVDEHTGLVYVGRESGGSAHRLT